MQVCCSCSFFTLWEDGFLVMWWNQSSHHTRNSGKESVPKALKPLLTLAGKVPGSTFMCQSQILSPTHYEQGAFNIHISSRCVSKGQQHTPVEEEFFLLQILWQAFPVTCPKESKIVYWMLKCWPVFPACRKACSIANQLNFMLDRSNLLKAIL